MTTAGLSASFALCLAAACAPAHVVSTPAPAPNAGDPIRYATRSDSGEFVQARLISLNSERLTYERLISGPTGPSEWVAGALATDSVAGLQVRVGRRGNAGRGALIGLALGLFAGVACASQEPGWLTPTPGECMASGTFSGLATGALIGALIRSDVWAPTALPARTRADPPTTAAVSVGPAGVGPRLPIRLPSR